jgi:hypothetical protein
VKISEITAQDVADYLRLDGASDTQLPSMMVSAKQFIIDQIGCTEEELDSYEDLYTAFMVLVADMYDHRSMYVEKGSINQVADSILFRHRRNFL